MSQGYVPHKVDALERVMNLLVTLLHAKQPLDAKEIAKIGGYPDDKESFGRAFERDKKLIRSLGIKITTSGPLDDLYIIKEEDYYLQLDLTTEEQRALSWAATALLDRQASVLNKLRSASAGVEVGQLCVLDYSTTVNYFHEAITESARIKFKYLGQNRTLEPWRIIWSGHQSYVHGFDIDRQQERRFRLDRVEGTPKVLKSQSATFERLPMRPLVPWQFSDGETPVDVTICVDAPFQRYARSKFPNADVKEAADGSIELLISVSNMDNFIWTIIGFGHNCEVLSPAEARNAVITYLKKAEKIVIEAAEVQPLDNAITSEKSV